MSQDSCDDEDEDPTPHSAVVETPSTWPSTKEGQNNQEQAKPPYWKRLTFWSVVFNFTLAITTILLGLIAYWQLEATNEAIKISKTASGISESANKISAEALRVSQGSYQVSEQGLRVSEQTLKMQERAWLTVKGAQVRPIIGSGKSSTVAMEWRNSGRSPARHTKIRQRSALSSHDKLPNGPMPPVGLSENKGVVGPETSILVEFTPTNLGQPNIDLIKARKMFIYTFGTITYRDIFDIKHQTSFCFWLQDVEHLDMSPCGQWNKAD